MIMERGVVDNLSFLATIKACARGQQCAFTQHILTSMEKLKVEKTQEIYTAAMGSANDVFGQGFQGATFGLLDLPGAYASYGAWEWSLDLLREMRSTEVEVDAVAMGVALSVCLRARCWEIALHVSWQ